LEETRPDHFIYSVVTATKITAMPWHSEEKKMKNNSKKKCVCFFQNSSTFEFLTFWLSCCTQSFVITSKTYHAFILINVA